MIAGGLSIHAGLEMPWYLDWVGYLPGDMRIKKGDVYLYVPLTSALLASAVLSFLISLFAPKEK